MSLNIVSDPRYASTLGVAAAGALFGNLLGVATTTLPTVLATADATSPTDASLLLRVFARSYHRGRYTGVPLALTSSVLLSYASYHASTTSTTQLAYAAAAALCLAPIPFTLVIMKPSVKVLLSAEESADRRQKLGVSGALGDVGKFARLHWVRTGIAGLGLAVALWAGRESA